MRCVDIISICENIPDLPELLKSTLIEAGSEYSGNDIVCGKKYKFLMNIEKHLPLRIKRMTKTTSYFPSTLDDASTARCESYFKNLKHSDLGPD